jgi:AcrR family transcriptional regulator
MTTRPSTSPRRRMPRADRSAQLLEVAEQVFAERGFRLASMDEIADRAGITKPVLYDHFGSKDGLLAAVVESARDDLREAVTAAVTSAADSEHALSAGLRAYFDYLAAHAASWTVLLTEAEASSAAAEAMEAIRAEMGDFIAALMTADLRDVSNDRAQAYAQVVIGASERLARYARTGSGRGADELVSALMDVIWLGLDDMRAGKRWTATSASTAHRVVRRGGTD